MADMRLDDWVLIGVTVLKLLALGLSVMFLIVLWPRIVSIVSSLSTRARTEGEARRAYRQQVYTMSSQVAVPTSDKNDSSWRSPAMEQGSEPSGSRYGNIVPTLVEWLETLSDDELLDILARVKDAQGKPKYADSRIAKFIGGRVEDRTAQVRAVRGSEPPPSKLAPQLRVRDNGIERLIAKYGK